MALTLSTLVLLLVGTPVAPAQTDSPATPARRPGESEAAYQARCRSAEEAYSQTRIINKQPGETDTAYQARLRQTIKGILRLQAPIIEKRRGESKAGFKARTRDYNRFLPSLYKLIARVGEDEDAYLSRMAAWQKRQLSTIIPGWVGDNEATYQARLRATMGTNDNGSTKAVTQQATCTHKPHILEGKLEIHPKYAYKYFIAGFGDGQECALFGESKLKDIPLGSYIRVEGYLGTRFIPRGYVFAGRCFIYMDVEKVEILSSGK